MRLHWPAWFRGVVGAIRKDARTASDVFLTTTPHPLRSKTQTVALVTPEGAKTMTPTTQGRIAPDTDLVHLHACAVNGLRHALHLLTHGDMTGPELARAIGKATRATTAIKRMATVNRLEG